MQPSSGSQSDEASWKLPERYKWNIVKLTWKTSKRSTYSIELITKVLLLCYVPRLWLHRCRHKHTKGVWLYQLNHLHCVQQINKSDSRSKSESVEHSTINKATNVVYLADGRMQGLDRILPMNKNRRIGLVGLDLAPTLSAFIQPSLAFASLHSEGPLISDN